MYVLYVYMYLLLDPVNYNPLKKGSIKFLTAVSVKMVGCYDIGRAAAKLIADPDPWNGKILDVCMHACIYMYVLNTDDLNNAYKTVCLYMYICMCVCAGSKLAGKRRRLGCGAAEGVEHSYEVQLGHAAVPER